MATLQAMQKEISDTNIAKGFRDLVTSNGDRLALIHSEVSEALEEIRDGHAADEVYFDNGKPEGYLVELADCIIRSLDEFSRYGMDAEEIIRLKMNYNAGRPFLHGGKVL